MASVNVSSGSDPRRPTRIYRYKPASSSNKPGDDPSADYLNLLGMIFSMCGLMMRVRDFKNSFRLGLKMFTT